MQIYIRGNKYNLLTRYNMDYLIMHVLILPSFVFSKHPSKSGVIYTPLPSYGEKLYMWRYSQRNLTCTRPCNVSFASSSTYISMGCNLKRQQKNIGPHTHTHTYEEIVLVSWPSNCQRPCTLAFQCQPGMRSPFLSLFKALPLRNLQTKKLSPINLQLYCCYCMSSKKECRLTKLLCPVVLP
jgi:hypothetical protein